ncbi:MAG: 16S rRNA (guanine(966)-N(2))-methyltransferase RsmD [Sphingobacteriia bacterium]|nr:16S rRNA (guanine(966)-N(2))-methyltransferase RsmD [Sphingobacteriia bacterium]
MRIIAGKHRAKKLLANEKGVRPTTSRTREAIFNILENVYPDNLHSANILDLCAGSGALGLEALSRGAKFATFVDNNADSIKYLKINIENCKEKNNTKIIFSDVIKLNDSDIKYDLIFLDPPYETNFINKCLNQLIEKNFIAKNALIIIETDAKIKLEIPDNFSLLNERLYGNTKISLLNLL